MGYLLCLVCGIAVVAIAATVTPISIIWIVVGALMIIVGGFLLWAEGL